MVSDISAHRDRLMLQGRRISIQYLQGLMRDVFTYTHLRHI